jgi:5-enolpyruvylshikimate-3-phosphate synthase
LTGITRLQERPFKDLTDALQKNGCDITFLKKNGFVPFCIKGDGLPGGEISLASNVSSQFVSSILMSAPYAKERVTLKLTGALIDNVQS